MRSASASAFASAFRFPLSAFRLLRSAGSLQASRGRLELVPYQLATQQATGTRQQAASSEEYAPPSIVAMLPLYVNSVPMHMDMDRYLGKVGKVCRHSNTTSLLTSLPTKVRYAPEAPLCWSPSMASTSLRQWSWLLPHTEPPRRGIRTCFVSCRCTVSIPGTE